MARRGIRALLTCVVVTLCTIAVSEAATSDWEQSVVSANHLSALSLTPTNQGGVGLFTVGWMPGSSQVAYYGKPGGHGMDDLFEGRGFLWLAEWKANGAREDDYWRKPDGTFERRRFYQGSFEWLDEVILKQLRTGNAMDQAAAKRIEGWLELGTREGERGKYIRYLYGRTLTPAVTGKAAEGHIGWGKLGYARRPDLERNISWQMKGGRPQLIPSKQCAAIPSGFTMSPARNPAPGARATVTVGQAADAARVVRDILAPFVKAREADAMAQRAYQQLGLGVANIRNEIPQGQTAWLRVSVSGPEECVDDTQGFTVRVGFTPASGHVSFHGMAACQPGARQEVYPLRTGRTGRESWESVRAPQSTMSQPGWTSMTYVLCVAGTGAPAAALTATPTAQLYAFVLDGIGVVLATPDQVQKTSHCVWNGGGPRPCPGAPAAKSLGHVGGPYASEQDARADLKSKLTCFRGHWGTFINIGNGKAWLQNNVGEGDCRSVKQL